MKNLLFVFTFITIGLVSLNAQKSDYSFSEPYEADGPTQLSALSSDGNISVQSHNKSTIEVHYIVTKRGKTIKGSKDEVLNKIKKESEILVEEGSNSLSVVIKDVPNIGFTNYEEPYNIDIKFYVPEETSCNIISSDGDLAIHGLSLDQKCVTSDGNIAIKNVKGDLDLVTSDGDIALKNIGGDVRVITSDGNIAAKNVAGKLDAHSEDGNVSRK